MKRRSFFAFIIIMVCFSLIFSALACDTDKIVDEGEKDQSGDVSGEVTDPSDEDKEDQDTDQDNEDTDICSHVDANKDGICDKCGSSVENDKEECTHEDKNGDGICDKCGSNVENDKEECTHEDKNGDGICDLCGEKLCKVVDYDDYSAEVISSLEKENITPSNISEWSVLMQDALKDYLDTNYGEKFLTGDRYLDKVTVKEIVGYDFDFENNIITALIQTTSTYDENDIYYNTRSLEINTNSLYQLILEYLTNNNIKQKYGDLTNNYEDEAGNKTVFVKNGQKLDFSSTAIIEGKYKNADSFTIININQSREYSYDPSEFSALITQYNWMFADEGYSLSTVYSAIKISQPRLTAILGKYGVHHMSTGVGLDSNGNFVKFGYSVESLPETPLFLDITPTSTYAKLNDGRNYFNIFGNGQTIVRVKCLEQELK